jgi:hypothetical protein
VGWVGREIILYVQSFLSQICTLSELKHLVISSDTSVPLALYQTLPPNSKKINFVIEHINPGKRRKKTFITTTKIEQCKKVDIIGFLFGGQPFICGITSKVVL